MIFSNCFKDKLYLGFVTLISIWFELSVKDLVGFLSKIKDWQKISVFLEIFQNQGQAMFDTFLLDLIRVWNVEKSNRGCWFFIWDQDCLGSNSQFSTDLTRLSVYWVESINNRKKYKLISRNLPPLKIVICDIWQKMIFIKEDLSKYLLISFVMNNFERNFLWKYKIEQESTNICTSSEICGWTYKSSFDV